MLYEPVSVPALPKLSHTTTKLPVPFITTGGNNWLFVVYSGPPRTGCAKAIGSQEGWLVVRSTSSRDRPELPNMALFRAPRALRPY